MFLITVGVSKLLLLFFFEVDFLLSLVNSTIVFPRERIWPIIL